MRTRHRALFSSSCLALLLAAASAASRAGDFLDVRNDNPLLRGLYLPLPVESAAADGAAVSGTLAIENTINAEARGAESLFVDGEAVLVRLSFDAPLAPRWRMRLNLPLIRDSGGALDTLIDRWHGWFGLPRGVRPRYPRDRLQLSYDGAVSFDRRDSQSGIGDASAELGWYALDEPSRTLAVWGGIEAPTGSARALTGNGAWDAGLWLHAAWRGRRWQAGAEAGVLRPFGDEVFGGLAQRTSVFGRAAAGYAITPAWVLRLQLEAQSARLKDTQLRFLGPALIVSAGLQHRFGRRWDVQWGFAEDAAVNTAPDVTFYMSVRRATGAR
jgi:hypothetical protein